MGRWDANNNKLLQMIAQFVSPKDGHQRVHEGTMFSADCLRGEGNLVADNGTLVMSMTTGASVPHLIFEVSTGGDAEVQLIETASVTVASALTSHNRSRSRGPGLASCAVASTVTPGGTLIFNKFVPGGPGPLASGGNGKPFEQEWILKSSTTYAIVATNRGGATKAMSIGAMWYEPDD